MQPETRFKLRVLKDLKRLGVFFIKIAQQSTRGDPDFVICASGLFIGMELKTDKGKLSPLQAYKLHKIHANGGISILATPKTWPEALRFITCLPHDKEVPECLNYLSKT